MNTNPSRPFYHTAHTRAHLISCVGRVTLHHRNQVCFKPSSTSVRPYSPLDHTGIQCLINWHGLTFDDLPPPPHAPGRVQRSHRIRDTPTYPITGARSCAPMSKHWPVKPRPTGSNKTCINAHAHTAHGAWNTLASLIRPN